MFYSHEILTSRKYGVATVWLVATLGAKSNTKKVSKKAILDVDVKKACKTIMEPEAPMALRLQSNLLYGVSRVYNQQWEYLLVDAQSAQNMVRTLFKTARNNDLDVSAGKSHPDLLIMMDDPAFAIDMPAPLPDFDFANMDLNPKGDSQRSSQSMLSIRGRSGSVVSHTSSVLGLNIPSSNGGSYQLPMLDPFGGSSIQKPFGAGPGIFNDEEDMAFQDEELFEFGADGEFREIPASEHDARRRAGSAKPQYRPGSGSAASGRVRKEHEDALAGIAGRALDFDGDYDMPVYGDEDLPMFPGADPFPVMTGALGSSDLPLHLSDEDCVFDASQDSSVSAEAQMTKKKAKKVKTIKADQASILKTVEIARWQKEYVQNMEVGNNARVKQQATLHAKKNAFHYVCGSGISGVGEGIGSSKFASPLAMFSGNAFLAKITGKPIVEPESKKRSAPVSPDGDDIPNKRAREGEIGRGEYEDDNNLNMDDDQYRDNSVEIGREAQSALTDHPPSAMPWNMSSSLHSLQRGQSSSIQGRIGLLGSQRGSIKDRRLTSPLIGRGSNVPGELDHFSQMMNDEDMVMYGRSDDGLGMSSQISALAPRFGTSSQAGAGDDFEIFGAAADVDTQTAGSSQWMKDVMDRESNNFFEYVKNTIEEKSGDELGDEDVEVESKTVTFEELFATASNSSVVAAQAFYHVLSLATKRRVWVEQDVDAELLEPFGEIRIGVLA
ncbi:uncharacterized protein L3040_000228 [Drepanopeziza brunnea f. sp. 'multigermtubi']|uniref:Putative Rad21/Rec8 N terminal domain-containing protein n=1 Tax=Marssonina brunnea f. sp. multigermtubi (strain MB_m1) TaxID=1072389 RepID=K1WUK8_MARBU|nr:putative Rad21/Rec8 N terminal domain-containing protein [Drepanopeziza brunnea f. sp. 'multigermtubi' MB_m1]EKD12303.1 putative Rad21/Rec8 N terminal domain-containing protein [Drepanopeziza brunnea f. sp. 'multigermtubi' MB_m1]KAJ5053938.1 hypothetical protein L3040_000228 [Drepanopeziza brunnea f. sp. 'multigermtubi']